MRLTIDKGELALPEDFKLEITANHPFFSDEGTASAPVTLPPSPENRQLLEYPENPNRARKFTRIYPGTVGHATFARRCQLVISGGSRDNGISAVVALQESDMYASIQDLRLRDLFKEYRPSVHDTPWTLYHRRRLSQNDPLTFFPVACDQKTDDGVTTVTLLNQPSNDGKMVYYFSTVKIGDATRHNLTGYRLTPFMYLDSLIDMAFGYCGYNITENVFSTDPELRKIVVLNRCADALMNPEHAFNPSPGTRQSSWVVHGNAIVPNISMGELITWLHDKFGAFVTVMDKTVSIRLFRDVVNSNYDLDLSEFLLDRPDLTYPEPRTIHYEQETDIDSADPPAGSLEQLRAAYPTGTNVNSLEDISGEGLFRVLSLGKYYYKDDSIESTPEHPNPKMIGSEAIPFSRKQEDMEEEEIAPSDSFVPMIYSTVLHQYVPYVGDSVHENLEIEGKEKTADLPIMICYAQSFEDDDVIYYVGNTTGHAYGTAQSGETMPAPLTPEGMVPKYFSEWWTILADGAPEFACSLKIPLITLGKMDLHTPKLLKGNKVLIKSIRYSISPAGLSTCQAVLQLLPSYDNTMPIPTVEFDSTFIWTIKSTRTIYPVQDKYEILETDGVADYTSSDAPNYAPTAAGEKAKVRDRWLKYRYHVYDKSFWHWSHSYYDRVEYYQEYFIGTLQ